MTIIEAPERLYAEGVLPAPVGSDFGIEQERQRARHLLDEFADQAIDDADLSQANRVRGRGVVSLTQAYTYHGDLPSPSAATEVAARLMPLVDISHRPLTEGLDANDYDWSQLHLAGRSSERARSGLRSFLEIQDSGPFSEEGSHEYEAHRFVQSVLASTVLFRGEARASVEVSKGTPLKDVWGSVLEVDGVHDPRHHLELLKKTEIESFMIVAGGNMLKLMYTPVGGREPALAAHEAVRFYAPLAEYLGYDALATAIRDIAFQRALVERGDGHLLQQSTARIEALRRNEEYIMSSILEDLDSPEEPQLNYTPSIGPELLDLPKNMVVRPYTGMGRIDKLVDGIPTTVGTMRIKGLGSDLRKGLTRGDRNPSLDPIAYTLIEETEQAQLTRFGSAVRSVANRDERALFASRRKGAVHARLMPDEFYRLYGGLEGLRQSGIDYSAESVGPYRSRSLRVTSLAEFAIEDVGIIPIEGAFQTHEQYRAAQEEANHALHKAGVPVGQRSQFVDAIRELRARVHEVGRLKRNSASEYLELALRAGLGVYESSAT